MTHRRLRLLCAAVLLVAVSSLAGAYVALASRSADPVTIRLALAAEDSPIGAKGRTLGLSRVVVPAGVELALHHHPGTQVAYVAEGNLTYDVKSGRVTVRRGAADAGPKVVRTIRAGHIGVLHAGDWIVEEPTTIHSAANRGSTRVVIYLATLFPTGSPPAIAQG